MFGCLPGPEYAHRPERSLYLFLLRSPAQPPCRHNELDLSLKDLMRSIPLQILPCRGARQIYLCALFEPAPSSYAFAECRTGSSTCRTHKQWAVTPSREGDRVGNSPSEWNQQASRLDRSPIERQQAERDDIVMRDQHSVFMFSQLTWLMNSQYRAQGRTTRPSHPTAAIFATRSLSGGESKEQTLWIQAQVQRYVSAPGGGAPLITM